MGRVVKNGMINNLFETREYSQSDVLISISDNVVTFDNIKHLVIYSKEEKISLFIPYIEFYVLCLTYMSPRSLLI